MNEVARCQRLVAQQLLRVGPTTVAIELAVLLGEEESLLGVQEGEAHLRQIRDDQMLCWLLEVSSLIQWQHVKLPREVILAHS